MSRVIVRTVYGSAIQTSRSMGIEHDIPGDFSALHYGGAPVAGKGALNTAACIPNLPTPLIRGMETAPAYDSNNDSDNIKTSVLCIGNGGHRYVAAVPPAPAYSSPIPHQATDSGFYNWIPFLVREATADINNAVEPLRSKYRLRRTILIGGVLYVAYFGRALNFTGLTPDIKLVTVDGPNTLESPFVPTINSLDPNPLNVTDFTIDDNQGSYVSVSATLNISFTADEVEEILNACEILYGSREYAIISEVGLCTGVDKLCDTRYANDTPYGATAIVSNQPTESVGTQVTTHISTHYPIVYANDGFELTLDLGATEPLFGIGNV